MTDFQPVTVFQPGDRVRGTIEGVISTNGDYIHAQREFVALSVLAGVEKLPDPPPEWQTGDVVRAGRYTTWLCKDGGEWVSNSGTVVTEWTISNDWLNGGITILVKDGKPVTP